MAQLAPMQIPTYSNDNYPDLDFVEHFHSCDYSSNDYDPYCYHPVPLCSLDHDHGLKKHLAFFSDDPYHPTSDYSSFSPKILLSGHPCHLYHLPLEVYLES